MEASWAQPGGLEAREEGALAWLYAQPARSLCGNPRRSVSMLKKDLRFIFKGWSPPFKSIPYIRKRDC